MSLICLKVDQDHADPGTACNLASGDLYNYPNASSIIDATQPLTFKWDTTCPITSSNVDLYLYEPTSSAGLIHVWEGVPFSDGQYTAILLPKWWNDTTTASLQLSIITSGAAAWDTSSPAGPVFTANYAASAMFATTTEDGSLKTSTVAAAATQSADAVFQNVASTQSHKGPAKGAIVAAVLVPLIVLAGVAAVAVRFWRAREQEKRRRWSQALSTHSNLEWEKGAHSGEKPGSILGRPSTHHSVRPMSFATSSVYGIENNMAGAGAAINFPRPSVGPRSHSAENVNSPNRASVRSSVVMPDGQIRQSRISFADIARPERRSRLSLGGDLRPNTSGPPGLFRIPGATKSATELGTPNRKPVARSIADDEEEDMNISPSQLQGPQAFADSEMRRVGDKQRTGRRSIMSLGGDKSRRGSAASALSTEDFKSAASARGSVDELRDMESVMRELLFHTESSTCQPYSSHAPFRHLAVFARVSESRWSIQQSPYARPKFHRSSRCTDLRSSYRSIPHSRIKYRRLWSGPNARSLCRSRKGFELDGSNPTHAHCFETGFIDDATSSDGGRYEIVCASESRHRLLHRRRRTARSWSTRYHTHSSRQSTRASPRHKGSEQYREPD